MAARTPKWSPRYTDLLMKAFEKGIVDFDMTGKAAVKFLGEHDEFAVIAENFSHKQVKNAMGRIKEQITPNETKMKEAKEKMDIHNELKNHYSE
jgi:hypothetical protein